MEANKSLNKLKKIKPNQESKIEKENYNEDKVYKKVKRVYEKLYNLKIDKKK